MTAPLLRDYQEQGVHWLRTKLKKHKAVLLADDAGLGKTVQAIQAAIHLGATRILIICPAGARRVWLGEITRWSPDWLDHAVLVEPGSDIALQPRLASKDPLVLIVGYDELSNLKSQVHAQLQRRTWDLMILDEAHYLKNPSNRTLAIYGNRGSDEGLQAGAAKVILLTGTPTPNHAGELWHHCRTLWPWSVQNIQGRPLSHAEFEDRFTKYRDTVYGRQITGSKNVEVLRETLKDVVLRRRKDEVLKELPPLVLQDIPMTAGHRWTDKLSPDARARVKKLDWSLDGASDDRVLQLLRAPDSGLATLRREIGEHKVLPTILWVQERMLSTNKLLIFAWHHSVIDRLRVGLAEFDPAVITGNTSPEQRTQAIAKFQTYQSCRVFIGQTLAAGTAITLTAASEVAIVEASWVPGENVQAICRAYRLGQRDSVIASFLYLPGTLDERIMQTFRRKASEISQLQGDIHADQSQSDPRHGNRARPTPVQAAAGSHAAYQRALGRGPAGGI